MSSHLHKRRDFLKLAALSPAALALAGHADETRSPDAPSGLDARGLPTIQLGKTGVRLPRMAVGTGSRFMTTDPETGEKLLLTALDQGLCFWDTAANYQNRKTGEYSEERIGRILKSRRKEVFVTSKVADRDAEGAKRTLEATLRRLQTDHIDLYKVHAVESLEDVDAIGARDGVLQVLMKYREEGVIRHIGFSGHTSAAAMKEAVRRYPFETMLIALNHHRDGQQAFEEEALPLARSQGLGTIAMKIIRPAENGVNVDPEKLIRYALSLPEVDVVNIGVDSMDVLNRNVALLKTFTPLTDQGLHEVDQALAGFRNNPDLPWMQPGYRDGITA